MNTIILGKNGLRSLSVEQFVESVFNQYSHILLTEEHITQTDKLKKYRQYDNGAEVKKELANMLTKFVNKYNSNDYIRKVDFYASKQEGLSNYIELTFNTPFGSKEWLKHMKIRVSDHSKRNDRKVDEYIHLEGKSVEDIEKDLDRIVNKRIRRLQREEQLPIAQNENIRRNKNMRLRINEEAQDNVAIIDFDKAELVSETYKSNIIIPIIQDGYTFRNISLELWGGSTWSWSINIKGFPTIALKTFHKVKFDVTYGHEIDVQQFIDAMYITVSGTQRIIKNAVIEYFNKKSADLVINTKGKLKQDMLDDVVVLMAQYSDMKDSTDYATNNNSFNSFEKFDKNKYGSYNQYVEVKLSEYLDNLPNTSLHLMNRQELDTIIKNLTQYLNHKNIEANNKSLNVNGIRLKGSAGDIAKDYIKALFNQGWKEITSKELNNININNVYKKDRPYGITKGSLKDVKTKPYSTSMGYGSLSSTTSYTPHFYIDDNNNVLVYTTTMTWD